MMWASVCPTCGVDVARVPPCRFCRARCCPCVHEEERDAERARRWAEDITAPCQDVSRAGERRPVADPADVHPAIYPRGAPDDA